MRRSVRGKSGAQDDNNESQSTPTRGSRQVAEAAEIAAADWSASPSPLSSLSTPASSAAHARRTSRRMTRDGRTAMAETNMGDDDSGSGSEGNDSVEELLSKASEVIRDEVYPAQFDEEEDDDEEEAETREAKRPRSSSPTKGEANAEGRQRGGSAKAGGGSGRGGWWPGKRGRPPKSAAGLQRQHKRQLGEGEAGDALDDGSDIAADDDDELDDDVDRTDEAGEAKISAYGELLGGREFICPVFRSPLRGSGQRLFVLSMDCCRFTGARDSYMLFKQHPRMRRVETTQQERDLLAERAMIPKVTRFRSIAMITARAAYREFGAMLVKDGRYITDDYWEAEKRDEAKYPEGTPVANMSVYHKVQAAHAAGMAPGSTRQARRITPLRSPTAGPSDQPPPHMALPPLQHSPAVSSWVQLEAQQAHQQHQRLSAMPPNQQPRHAGRTMASALMLAPQLLPLGEAEGDSSDAANAGAGLTSAAAAKPVFKRMRAAEIAEAAFDSAASAHRAHFDDSGFVDGAPLAHSLAVSWARAPSLANRLKQQQSDDVDAFGPMAFASGRVAREFNASVRMWRDDNGCTWVDPHTGIRQVPASLQPTCAYAQRVASTGAGVDTSVAFADSAAAEMPEPAAESYPIAVLPGQYQASFPVHRTRFGQSYQNAVTSYSYHWMRQLANQQQQLKMGQQQQQQLMMMQNNARRR
ncbi:chromatin structure-remodeling complex subunit RSC7 [Coemansia sp. RSA 455]|nr:chromatin structure-remodeling complex subunit RSC7 [Coemansia sp. S680]KAJ2258740.1 chromatin structure-remodeling complex subunit RSC7 [Coemansia sp. RSA 455]KAJ2469828.1 chromatin structure-remodeling complex subunit RSC7 [Coemansia sp. RSA 2337]